MRAPMTDPTIEALARLIEELQRGRRDGEPVN
jgi:hypothetical protein